MLCEDAITTQWKNGSLYILTFWEETKMLFKILVGILIFVILFLLKGFYDRQKYKDKIQFLLKQEWGMETRDEYSDKIFRNICFYHEQKKKESDIDDITWNDLEMDKIFMLLNHTRTSAGEEYLYHLLRSPLYQEEELDKREQLIEEITKQEDKRYDLEMALCDIGKTDQISVYEFLSLAKELDQLQVKRFPHLIACLAMIGSVVMLPFFPSEMILLLFVVMAVNAYFYYKAKAEMTSYLALFSFILRTIKKCDAISSVDFMAAKNERRRMKELAGKFRKFSRFSFLVSGGSSISGSLFDAVFDYVRILCHVDLIKIGTMIKEVCKKYDASVNEYLTAVFTYSIYMEYLHGQPAKRPIVICIPVNLRPYFDSMTTRNFFAMVSASFLPEQENMTLDEVVRIVKESLRSQINKEHLEEIFSYNVSNQKNILLRSVPIFIKAIAMRLVYISSARASTSTITNLGKIAIDEKYQKYIAHFTAMISRSAGQIMKGAVCSYQDVLSFTFTSALKDLSVERCFFRTLAKDGIKVAVETNLE